MTLAVRRTDSGSSRALRDRIKFLVQSNVDAIFMSTLGQVPDIAGFILGQIQLESSFNVNAIGPGSATSPNSTFGRVLASSAIAAKLETATPTQRANIMDGRYPFGLGQVMGYNLIRGADPSGKTIIEKTRPELVATICVNPGEDIRAKILGEANLNNCILAMLTVLESKYKAVTQDARGFYTRGDSNPSRRFATKISAAFGAYLGLGTSDVNGTTAQSYASAICYGSAYQKANGMSPSVIVAQGYRAAPPTDGSDMPKIVPPGCA